MTPARLPTLNQLGSMNRVDTASARDFLRQFVTLP
jgi:hypothetical protein